MKPIRILHRQLTCDAMMAIADKIVTERVAWRKALGVDQGFDIPDRPIPGTRAEIEAELVIVTELENAASSAR